MLFWSETCDFTLTEKWIQTRTLERITSESRISSDQQESLKHARNNAYKLKIRIGYDRLQFQQVKEQKALAIHFRGLALGVTGTTTLHSSSSPSSHTHFGANRKIVAKPHRAYDCLWVYACAHGSNNITVELKLKYSATITQIWSIFPLSSFPFWFWRFLVTFLDCL